MNIIYLDNNATTKIDPEVYKAMQPFLKDRYGNPSSAYSFGGNVKKDIETSREKIAKLLGCRSQDIIFTSCGTESNNLVVKGILELNSQRNHFITSVVEHPAIKNHVVALRKKGFRVTEVPVDENGNLDMKIYEESLDENTALVSIMYANNETGVIFPVEKLAEMAHKKGALFHADAVQAVGKIPIDLSKSNIDLLSLSGHKLHAPKGVGALFKKADIMLQPQMVGGHQEEGWRGGTENVASIIALGKACELASYNIDIENTKVKKLRDKLENGIMSKISDVKINGDLKKRLPNTTNIGFHLVEGEAVLLYLDREGICASSGSACTSGSLQPSHVLKAMNVPFTCMHGSVRFSLSRYNTDEEINIVLDKLPKIINKLRELSPFKSVDEVVNFGP